MTLEYFLREYLKARPLFLSLIRAKEAWLYQRYLPFARPILDVGCGDGFFVAMTFPHTIDVGLDVEGSRIHEATSHEVYQNLVTYDGIHIPFPTGHFRTIISNCVLEHVEHLPTVLSEVHRVLRPGGRFLTTVMARPWEKNMAGAALFGTWYQFWMRKKQVHRNLLTVEQWSAAFTDAGFSVQDVIGYLSPAACRLIDVCHYLSLPSLVTYLLARRWVVFSQLTRLYPIGFLLRVISDGVAPEHSGALLFVLSKKT